MEDPEEYVDFMVKYRDWVAIKRLGIRPDTHPEEIVYHLAGIRSTIDGHSYRILGVDTGALDKLAGQLTAGKSRSYESLGSALKEIGSADTKKRLKDICQSPTLEKLAESYLLARVVSSLNFEQSIRQETMAKLYPELKLKLPKGPGRKRKA